MSMRVATLHACCHHHPPHTGMAHMQAKGEVYSDEEDEEFDAGTGSEKDSDEDTDGEGEVRD